MDDETRLPKPCWFEKSAIPPFDSMEREEAMDLDGASTAVGGSA